MKFWIKESIDYSNDLWNPHGHAQRLGPSESIGNWTGRVTLGQQSTEQLRWPIKILKHKNCTMLTSTSKRSFELFHTPNRGKIKLNKKLCMTSYSSQLASDFLSIHSSGYLTEGFWWNTWETSINRPSSSISTELCHGHGLVKAWPKLSIRNLPTMQEIRFGCLSQEDPFKKEMATHSSILAWKIPMDRGAWRTTVHWVTKSQTGLSD